MQIERTGEHLPKAAVPMVSSLRKPSRGQESDRTREAHRRLGFTGNSKESAFDKAGL